MGFRTIVIKDRAKLDTSLNYLVYRGQEEKRIYLAEISTLILESTAVSLTCALLSELVKRNINVIFCDDRHSPESQLLGLCQNYHSSQKIKEQINWSNINKALVWTSIIKQKITNQLSMLEKYNLNGKEYLKDYISSLQLGDITNREGLSAKIYFCSLFGKDFSREIGSEINSALDYGYKIILSCFNRSIVANGYLTQIGIWHKNEFNSFNLSCDLMEPFRQIVDNIVYTMEKKSNFKIVLRDLINFQVFIDNKNQYLENAIDIYLKSIFLALKTGEQEKIKYYEL